MSDKSAESRGLVVHGCMTDAGKIRVSMDDVVEAAGPKTTWIYDVHVTAKDYDAGEFESLEISEKELADLGYYILARLRSFKLSG